MILDLQVDTGALYIVVGDWFSMRHLEHTFVASKVQYSFEGFF